MNKWEKLLRFASMLAMLVVFLFCAWCAYSLSTSPLPKTRVHLIKIPEGAEIRPRRQIYIHEINPKNSMITDKYNFIIIETAESVKLMAEKRLAALLVGYSSEKLEYWLSRGDGIFYYAVEVAPIYKNAERDFSPTVCFDPEQKAFVYVFGKPFFEIIILAVFACVTCFLGTSLVYPLFQKPEK